MQSALKSVDKLQQFDQTLKLIEQSALEPVQLMQIAEQMTAQNRRPDAIQLYQHWLKHCKSAINYVIHFNLAVALIDAGDLAGAEQNYRDAIFQKPDFAQAWFNLGTVIERQRRQDNALIIWQSMLDHPLVGPDLNTDLYVMVLNNMGRLQEEMRKFDVAEASLLKSLQADPKQPKVIQHWVHLRQKQCKWPTYCEVDNLPKGEMLSATSPLAMLAESDDPGLQLAVANHFIKDRVNLRVPELAPKQGYKHDKIRIAFLSSDFCLHAVSLLTVELLELIDRDRFEVYGFCWSREDGSALRARVVKAFDHYHRIVELDDEAAARLIVANEIDVLVDLQGLTSGARPNILSYRPAPIQLTYLGFPGPTGHPCIDYVIADEYLIPDIEKPYYSEKPLYLNVFQSSDRQRPIAALPTRAECGLPEDKFVFCTFNNNYKFTDSMFAAWMNILKRVPNSVFWMLADNEWSQKNLTNKAIEHGVDPSRLIFAPRVAPDQYLARYTAADLFLDAYPFNAGTTANDALWMGLPVLTRSGRTFASRMAGALLTALDMPELIATNIEEYEDKAVELASNSEQYRALRQKLVDSKSTSPLFDMPRFVKSFEDAVSSLKPVV